MKYKAGMTFEPRAMFETPGAFGTVAGDPSPAAGIDPSDHRYRSAVIQHRIARNVHDSLKYAETSLPRLLAAFDGVPGLSLDRQRRVLRGETSATFADLVFWADRSVLVASDVTRYLQEQFLSGTSAATQASARRSIPVAQTSAPGR